MKHTPEPWAVEELKGMHGYSIVKPGEWIVATTDDTENRDKANADRIVECINACEGMANPSVVKDILYVARDVVKRIQGKDLASAPPWVLDVVTEIREIIARAS